MSFELPTNITNIIQRFKSGSFFVLGRAGMDLYPTPQGTKNKEADLFKSDLGGSAANIAVSLSMLGSKASLISCFSNDSIGAFIKNKLKFYRVNIDHCHTISGLSKNSLALAENISHKPNVVIYRNNASDLNLSKKMIEGLDFSEASGLIITGTALSSEPSRSATHYAIKLSKKNGCPIILDLDYRKDAWIDNNSVSMEISKAVKFSDICVGNLNEFDIVSSMKNISGKVYAKQLSEKQKLIFLKNGDKGCEIIAENFYTHIGVFKVQTKKPFGAGDAFLGTLLNSFQVGMNVIEGTKRASAAAAIVVSRIGCSSAMPNPKELEEFINNNKIG